VTLQIASKVACDMNVLVNFFCNQCTMDISEIQLIFKKESRSINSPAALGTILSLFNFNILYKKCPKVTYFGFLHSHSCIS